MPAMRRRLVAAIIALAAVIVIGGIVRAATSLSSSIRVHIASTLTNTLGLHTASSPISIDKTISFADGSAAGQAHLVFSDQRTLGASASEQLDLAGGVTSAFGTTLTFASVKVLYVRASESNTNDVLVGGAASNGFATPFGDPTDVVKVKPGGVLLLVAPGSSAYNVTAGTGDLLKVANSGAGSSVTYDIVIIGA